MEKERELAIEILSEFEELLDMFNITIPDVDREGKEGEARLYGSTYYNLEDKITDLIKLKFKKFMKLFKDDLIDLCEDNQVMKDEISLYFKAKSKELFE